MPNLYFRDTPPSRSQPLLQRSFSDSVLYALPIVSIDPSTDALLIDLGDLLLNRDPANLMGAFPWVLSSYAPNPDTSYLESIQAFPENLELSTQLGFTGGGVSSDPFAALFAWSLASVPDPRAFSLTVRYSLSKLPLNPRYQPRRADERVGYFLTAFRTPAQAQRSTAFVRYINRWHLEKQDPQAAISPPKEPIVFWIENTVPPQYRTAIREGVLMWNQAFQQAGFQGAIEVRQMPDDADWDPADVRYNVIRWSDSFSTWAIGLGPSRVNPYTGEILDADVILDANVIRLLYQQYQSLVAATAPPTSLYLQLCGHRFQPLYLQWLSIQAGADPRQVLRPTAKAWA
ncbi:DUF5117 domain-containing protein [Halomicronema hongdechloris]|uniref:DUF5117 domain-containing protein n=1 Tax=Halomicronema hongdechloris TaxID=1209493 RepID=UPI00211B3634|nr:DUF5117 domain-containing protein [Halomicronema hongdechloris]